MKKYFFLLMLCSFTLLSCAQKKSVRYLQAALPRRSSIAVIIDSPNNIKNVVLAKFMQNGFKVKAFNASDLYTIENIFDIKDYKHIAYEGAENSISKRIFGSGYNSLLATEKVYDNIYKLHVYNFETHKAEVLKKINENWEVKYLVLLELNDWEEVSWGRVINLETNDLLWVENYAAKYNDNLESVVNHFIASLQGKRIQK